MDVKKWKQKFKDTWDERRKHVILEGKGGIIYPTRFTPQYNTSQKPMPSVILPHANGHNPISGNAEILIKIIGLTIASLLAFIIISFIIVWICRHRLNNAKKRKSSKGLSQGEDTYHIYAEIEPLTKNDIESPSNISEMIPLPTTMQTRLSGVRYVSDQIFRLLGTNSRRSKTNDSIFFSKQSHSVHFPPLPPVPYVFSGDRKDKRRAESQKLSSAPCPQMEWQVSSISSDVLVDIYERKNVYNPLNRDADPAPYDHLKLEKTGSGAHMTDEVSPVLPHVHFVLEKKKEGNHQHEDIDSHPYFILEKEEGNLDKEDKSNPKEQEGVDEGDCTTKSATIHYICPEDKSEIDKVHTYFVLESAAGSVCSNHVKVLNTPFEDNLEQQSENSSSQHHTNTDSSRASFERSKNILSLDDNEIHADAKPISTRSSSHLDKIRKRIRQSNDIQNYIWIEPTEDSVDTNNDEASNITFFAEDNSMFDQYIDHKDCIVCSSTVDNAMQDTSFDDYIEPIKSKTFSDYLELHPLVL